MAKVEKNPSILWKRWLYERNAQSVEIYVVWILYDILFVYSIPSDQRISGMSTLLECTVRYLCLLRLAVGSMNTLGSNVFSINLKMAVMLKYCCSKQYIVESKLIMMILYLSVNKEILHLSIVISVLPEGAWKARHCLSSVSRNRRRWRK